MKWGVGLWFLLTVGLYGSAQTIPQLTEQLALDIEKLAHMKAILSDMYNAYTIIDKGYSNVKEIVHGNFDLHRGFLDALFIVAPAVKSYGKVTEIISVEMNIVREGVAGYNQVKANGRFTTSELSYLGSLYNHLLERSLDGLDNLSLVMTDGQLRMSDAQRLGMIDRIWAEQSNDLAMLRSVNNATSLQSMQRAKTGGDIESLRSIYGIK